MKSQSVAGRIVSRRVIYLCALCIAMLVGVGVVLRFSAPLPDKVIIGSIQEFPPRTAPYWFARDDIRLWIVHRCEGFTIFDARTPASGAREILKWVPSNSRFEDPLTGSKFTLNGDFIEGPAVRDLDRYAYHLDSHQIVVELWHTIPGEVLPPSCRYANICRIKSEARLSKLTCEYQTRCES